ncbi:MAG: threonyl-tRNA synthetase editing domain-containing protein, partial [Candidatus Geothermarchaeales archaeon]
EMKTLYIHASKFSYRVRERVKIPTVEEAREGDAGEFENTLVTFVTVERGDLERLDNMREAMGRDMEEVLGRIKADSVVLYPYSHLSSKLSRADHAVKVLAAMHEELDSRGIRVHKAPFGWYKAFDLSCLGHPLSELSRAF